MSAARGERHPAALPRPAAFLPVVLLKIVVLSACCSSSSPDLYELYPQPGAKTDAPALRVKVRRPKVPAYLDRPHLVRRVGHGHLELAGTDWWGSPLEEMIGATMEMNLSERLPNCSVYAETGTISVRPDMVVELQIQRFEATHTGSVELLAQVALHVQGAPKGAVVTRHALSARLEEDGTAAVVRVMSRLLAELSDQVAQSIAQRAPPRPQGGP